ncbi:MAG TPA: hypothetical protein PLV83_00885 [Bacilli bacterium]|nr:hypothetical protein [Bacilli bacterium]
MGTFTREHNNLVETLITIFTVHKGSLKVLLIKNKIDPYKGYWILPGSPLKNSETLESNITDAVFDQTGILKLYIEQCCAFSGLNRNPDNRVIGISFMGLADSTTLEVRREEKKDIESEWFSIDELPKTGYDHEEVIKKNIECLKKKIVNINILRNLFPSDFTIPELQKIFEQILNKKLDRRNFRKRIITMDLLEDTNEFNIGGNGRPAKLYRFKENISEKNLF